MKFLYKIFFRPLLFKFDPEKVHNAALSMGRSVGAHSFLRSVIAKLLQYRNPILETKVAGITFKNPIGLAAGFDKNGTIINVISDVGFGFTEIGSVTAHSCAGNPKPRLWRLPKDRAIAVHYGLPSIGADAVANSLHGANPAIPIGISIAKTNDPAIAGKAAVDDYAYSVKLFEPLCDYLAINVSCPNAADGREFCEPDNLSTLLNGLDKAPITKPVFIKLKPDLSHNDFNAILNVCESHNWITGFIISNITHNYNSLKTNTKIINEQRVTGGISGKPVQELSNDLLSYAYGKSNWKYIFIGCGGVFNASDAYEKIKRGASLVQLITGMIYEGPSIVGNINRELVSLLRADGFRSIAEAVGSAHRV